MNEDAGERNKRVHEIAKRLFPMDEDCWPEAEALILDAIRAELEAVRQIALDEAKHWSYADIPAQEAVELALDNLAAAISRRME